MCLRLGRRKGDRNQELYSLSPLRSDFLLKSQKLLLNLNMGYIQNNLTSDEKIIKEYKLSKFVILEIIMSIIILIFILHGIKLLIHYFTTEQCLTDKRVIRKSGLISRDIQEMRLSKIETVEYKQSFWGRIFNYGNIKVTGTLTSFEFFSIDNPRIVKKDIDEVLH